MSRAFTKEDAGDPDDLPERHQSAAPNYVTPGGLADLRRQALQSRSLFESLPKDGREWREARRDMRYFEGRVASAILVDPKMGPADEVRFGASVTLRGNDGKGRRIHIVGQDEADEAQDKFAWDSPLSMALLGARVGDLVESLAVEAIAYSGR